MTGEIETKEANWKRNFSSVYNKMNFFKYLKNSKTHLDFGCGFGIFTYLLAKKHPEIMFYGKDKNRNIISIAIKKYSLKNLSFTPKNQTKYDSMSIMYVLHHIENPELKLKELMNNLNSEGKVLILEFKLTEKKKFFKYYNARNHAGTIEEYYKVHNRWTKEQFEQTCKNAGLKTLLLEDFGDFWFVYIGEK